MSEPAKPGTGGAMLPLNLRLAGWIRRLALPCVLLGGLWLWRGYGMLTVPAGMDTLPDTHPPGTRCLVEKRPRHVVAGAVVFVDVSAGTPDDGEAGTVLLRVVETTPDGRVTLAADNTASPWASLVRQPLPESAIRALVLVTFLPMPQVPDGR